MKLLIADLLSGAAKLEIKVAIQKINRPISIPLGRYEKFLSHIFHTIQITKLNISTVDIKMLNEDINTARQISRPYILSIMLEGNVAVCTVGPSVNVVRSTIIQMQKANSIYSKNTNALLLGAFELIGAFIILRSGL
ncbi:MAG: hypothetical protein JW837_17665 [Sedimentisphaerales bacterium]|nr:hypothetical protein [Sedimentisphaerales bacterium]